MIPLLFASLDLRSRILSILLSPVAIPKLLPHPHLVRTDSLFMIHFFPVCVIYASVSVDSPQSAIYTTISRLPFAIGIYDGSIVLSWIAILVPSQPDAMNSREIDLILRVFQSVSVIGSNLSMWFFWLWFFLSPSYYFLTKSNKSLWNLLCSFWYLYSSRFLDFQTKEHLKISRKLRWQILKIHIIEEAVFE